MRYVVLSEVKKPGKAFYTIADAGTRRVVGTARVDYNKRKSFWTFKAKAGNHITDKRERQAMAEAVSRFLTAGAS